MDTPEAPDPVATAQAQSGLNTDTALTSNLLNMTNQVGPWGSTTYSPTGSSSFVNSEGKTVTVPQYTQTTTYNPAQQAIFDQTTNAQTNIADIAAQQSSSLKNYLQNTFNFNNGQTFNPNTSVPTAQSVNPQMAGSAQNITPTDFSYTGSQAQNDAYDLASKRILPQQQQATDALRTQLINQGIRPGTAAWNQQMTLNSQANNDQLNQLALNGQQQFYNEALGTAQNNFGQNLAAAGQNNSANLGVTNANNAANLAATGANNSSALAAQQAQYGQGLSTEQQQYQEALTNRNQPLNEITALLSGSQVSNPTTGFTSTPQTQVAGVDYTGLVNNNYNQQVASSNAALGGLFGLAGSAATAGIKYSDARVKEDIRRIGTLDNGLPVYSYRYVWGGPIEIGVMAQDVEGFRPEAVHEVNGIKAVDYAKAVL